MIAVRIGRPSAAYLEKAAAELARARQHYGAAANQSKEFGFAVYKLDEVKNALNTAYGFKCAYCESYFGATQPLDVEHYRPKSGVRIDNGLRWGLYYWLAADWDNLLPSCIDCNRARKQRLPDGTEVTLGKLNQFPIADESRRATPGNEGSEREEGRLLLHPGRDRPSSHLEFDAIDGLVLTRSRKGEASRQVYGLLRDGLVRARKERQLEIRTHIVQARRLALKLQNEGSDPDLELMLVEEIGALERFADASRPYTAMARQLVEPVLEELRG